MKIFLRLIFIAILFYGCGNDPEADFPVVSIENTTVIEANRDIEVSVNVILDRAFSDNVLITVATEAGTADENDFQPIIDLVVPFGPGDLSKEVKIAIRGDKIFEESEEFKLVVVSAQNAKYEGGDGIITIENDDEDTSLRIPETGYSTPESYDGWNLVWQDEFNEPELDRSKWVFDIGGSGWGNNELQYYTEDNVSIEEGNLVITAIEEQTFNRNYSSSRIKTEGKFDFQYGRVDIRGALPKGQGIWPAFWMLGANFSEVGWPYCGEIDIMEMIGGNGRESTVHGTAHWQDDGFKADFGGSYTLDEGTLADQYHVYSIIWNQSKITWYIDDIKYHEMSITSSLLSEFRAPHFFIINLAVGGNWPGSPDINTYFPQHLIVDYIRVFQR